MRLRVFVSGVGVCLSVLYSGAAFPWGATGHRVITKIAENHLSKHAAVKLKQLMGSETLVYGVTWLDEVRSDPDRKRFDRMNFWHVVEVPFGQTYETSKKNPSGDVVQGLEQALATLKNAKASKEEKVEAVRILTHTVGDLHMPLHVSNGLDRAGSWCQVLWVGEIVSLHRVWDDKMIQFMELSYSEYVPFLDFPTREQIREWQHSVPVDWVAESQAIRDTVYPSAVSKEKRDGFPYCKKAEGDVIDKKDMPELGYPYFYKYRPVYERRLVQAGIRLAGLLNSVFK